MTLSEIKTKVYGLLGIDASDTVSYPDSRFLIDLNLWHQKATTMILESQDESDSDDSNRGTYLTYKVTLTTNRDIQISPTINWLKVKNLSISYDGVHVYRATPFDSNEKDLPIVDAANTAAQNELDSHFSKTNPKYDVKNGSLWFYPRASSSEVDAGAYAVVEFSASPVAWTAEDLSTGTKSPGFDLPFHAIIPYGMSAEYAAAKRWNTLAKDYGDTTTDYEIRLRRHYSTKQLDRQYTLSGDYQSYK